MFLKVVPLIFLYVLEANCLSIPFEDAHLNNKDVLILSDSLGKYYPYWKTHSDEDSNESEEDNSSHEDLEEPFDSWSLVWYIASFGGLIAFFLVVSCSEWCCRKHIREQQSRRGLASAPSPTPSTETPPPAYDLFAPPSYDSLNYAGSSEKSEYDIYVVPVHAINTLVDGSNATRQREEEDPPSYSSVSQQSTNNRRASES